MDQTISITGTKHKLLVQLFAQHAWLVSTIFFARDLVRVTGFIGDRPSAEGNL